MTVKISVLFQQNQGGERAAGWSETWYADGTVSANGFSIAGYVTNRTAFLSNQCTIVGHRVSDMQGTSQVFKRNSPGSLRAAVDIPQMALNVTVLGAGVSTKKVFQLRGITDYAVTDGLWVPPAGMEAAVRTFLQGLGAAGCKFRAKNSGAARSNVLSIAPDGTFSLAAGAAPVLNDRLQLMRVRDINGKNMSGTYLVVAGGTGLPNKLANWPNATVGASGQARVLSYNYLAVAPAGETIGVITTRKVGRPFFLYRGRQKK